MTAPASGMHCITPGLALIDPDLAAAARTLLPEPGAFKPNWQTSVAPTAPRRPRRLRVPAILGGTVIVATLLSGGLGQTSTEQRSTIGARTAAPGIQHADAASRAAAARTYRWPSVLDASSYELRLLKGTEEVYRVTTTAPTTDLPANLHLAPGRYTWTVTPNLNNTLSNAPAPIIEGTLETRSAS